MNVASNMTFVEVLLICRQCGWRAYAEWLDVYHPTKEYAYPYTGYKSELSFEQLRDGLKRFRIPRDVQLRLFSHS